MKMKRLWRKCDYFPCFFSARWCSLHLIFVCFLKCYHFDLKKWKKFEQVFFLPEFAIFSLPEVSKWCWTSSIMLGGRGTPHISVWDFLMTSSGLVSGPPTIDHFVWYSRPRSARRVLHWFVIN